LRKAASAHTLAIGNKENATPSSRRQRARPPTERRSTPTFEVLDEQSTLTANQWRILGAAIIGDALEFFDYFLIASF
jgi:hypothetical protein